MQRIKAIYKNAYSGLSPSTWWLSLVILINRSGTMVVPFMALYLTQTMHVSIGQAGIVMAMFGLGAICGGIIGGKLTDRSGFYNVQLFALTAGGISFIILGHIHNYYTICAFSFFLSLVNDSFRPANSAAIAHYTKEENRTRSYSLNRLAINLGWAMGGALGGIIASKNYHLLFWIDGLTNIGAAILLRAVLSPARNNQTPARKKGDTERPVLSAYRDKAYIVFTVFTILFAYSFFQSLSMLPLFYNTQLHFSPFIIGIVMAFNGILIALFEMVIVFRLEGKAKNLQFIMTGTLLTGVSFILYNLFPGTVLLALIATLTWTAGEILALPFMNSYWISRTTTNNRGQYAGLYTVAWSAAQVLGPSTGGQIAQRFGFSALWWTVGGLCLVAAIGYKWLQLRTDSGN